MPDSTRTSLSEILDVRAVFEDRPRVVPGDLRSAWRVALLSMILQRCYGRSATLEQVHVIGSAVLTESGRQRLSGVLANEHTPESSLIRFDPAWSRTMDLAVGIGLAEWTTTGRLRNTEEGNDLGDELLRRTELLEPESAFLLDYRFSQAMLDRTRARS